MNNQAKYSEGLLKNLLASYNEALDSNSMDEETARTSIEGKYNVVFTEKVGERFTKILPGK